MNYRIKIKREAKARIAAENAQANKLAELDAIVQELGGVQVLKSWAEKISKIGFDRVRKFFGGKTAKASLISEAGILDFIKENAQTIRKVLQAFSIIVALGSAAPAWSKGIVGAFYAEQTTDRVGVPGPRFEHKEVRYDFDEAKTFKALLSGTGWGIGDQGVDLAMRNWKIKPGTRKNTGPFDKNFGEMASAHIYNKHNDQTIQAIIKEHAKTGNTKEAIKDLQRLSQQMGIWIVHDLMDKSDYDAKHIKALMKQAINPQIKEYINSQTNTAIDSLSR